MGHRPDPKSGNLFVISHAKCEIRTKSKIYAHARPGRPVRAIDDHRVCSGSIIQSCFSTARSGPYSTFAVPISVARCASRNARTKARPEARHALMHIFNDRFDAWSIVRGLAPAPAGIRTSNGARESNFARSA